MKTCFILEKLLCSAKITGCRGRIFSALAACLFSLYACSQNLVPNPSFEQYNYNTNLISNIPGAPKYWKGILSPDWFHTNNILPPNGPNAGVGIPQNFRGWQNPKTGLGYAGFYSSTINNAYTREMLYVNLNESLIIGTIYCVSFYLSLADTSAYSNSLISSVFLTDTNYLYNINPIPPHEWHYYFTTNVTNSSGFLSSKTDWMRVEGSFVADSTYSFILIGAFSNVVVYDTLRVPGGDQTNPNPFAYYYLDDVSVTAIKPANAGNDTTISDPGLVQLGASQDDNAFYEWWPHTGIADTSVMNPIAYAGQSTTWYVRKTQCGVVSYDSIHVTVQNPVTIKEVNKNKIRIYPNPVHDKLQIETDQPFSGNILFRDLYGRVIIRKEIKQEDGIFFNIEKHITPPGMYFVELRDDNENLLYIGKIIVQH